jgi:hypothetical protein
MDTVYSVVRLTRALGARFIAPVRSTAVPAQNAGQIIEMRNRLNEARAALGLAPVAYGAPALTPGPAVITGAQIEELRGGVK